jgi:hypothetical protein
MSITQDEKSVGTRWRFLYDIPRAYHGQACEIIAIAEQGPPNLKFTVRFGDGRVTVTGDVWLGKLED